MTREKELPKWLIASELVDYRAAVAEMETRVAAIRNGAAPELVWLLEHPALYTAGTSANPADLLNADGLQVYQTGRGGQYTWHGPGQRVAYVMLDLSRRGADVRRHVRNLEEWIIRALAQSAFGCAAGSPIMASPSMWSRTCPTMPGSSPAESPTRNWA